MIHETWPRVAAIHCTEGGEIGCVWMAYERDTDTVHLYDSCVLKREVLAVIAESLNARGRYIPVAWRSEDKAISEDLLKRGVNMMVDECDDGDAMAEVISRTIWERMRTHRIKVERRLNDWIEEASSFQRTEGKVPKTGNPLMSATRHAMQMLDQGRRPASVAKRTALYPKSCVV